MERIELQTENLRVVLQTKEEVEGTVEAMSPYEQAQISAYWLARLRASSEADPWVHSFRLIHRDSGTVTGMCSFKGPPVNGIVEISYGVAPDRRGKGYATEAARALVGYASTCREVRLVRAHTLPDAIASKRVLVKCGFRYVGEVSDPEDGLVHRFERELGNESHGFD